MSFTFSEHFDKQNLQTNLYTNEIQILRATLEFFVQDFSSHRYERYELQIKETEDALNLRNSEIER